MRFQLLFIFLILSMVLFAQNNTIVFTENKKQFPSNVLFKADIKGGFLFLEKGCLTYVFHSLQPSQLDVSKHKNTHSHLFEKNDFNSTIHSYKVHFVDFNTNCFITSENKISGYENYFIGYDKSKWSNHIKSFLKVTYHNIWEGIDLILYQNGSILKYDFVVHPNANPNIIKLKYEGIDSIKIEKNNIVLKTSVNDVIERKPVTYQYSNAKIDTIQSFYVLDDSNKTISFRVYNYNKKQTLFIDPELIFSTYTGSTSDNWGFTATFDNEGNVYSGGIEYVTRMPWDSTYIPDENGYPIKLGSYQIKNKGGNCEISIIKYDPTGTKRLYATYLGGEYAELPHSMVVNSKNELILYGTTSSPDFPIVNGYDNTFNGGKSIEYDNIGFPGGLDLFVAKFSPDGSTLLASTYVGGSDNDGLNFKNTISSDFIEKGNDSLYYNYGDGARGEVIVDKSDNVYIGSCTFSTDFPVNGGFQSNNKGGEEGVVIKLNSDLSKLVWSSYLGGSNDDAVYSIDVDSNSTVYVAGGTNSIDLQTTTKSLQTSYIGGSADAFVAKINTSGSKIDGLTYWGSGDYDQAYFVRVDKLKHIYIYGQTKAIGKTLLINALYGQPNSGQFISKFNNTLDTIVWSTVFGTGVNQPNISPTAMSVDVCFRIYIAGVGREWPISPYDIGWVYNPSTNLYRWGFDWSNVNGTKNMPISPDAYQSVTDGKDFYFMVLDDKASMLDYATFFGEQYDNGAYYETPSGQRTRIGCIPSGRDHVDGGTSRFDKVGNIYQSVCASCGECNAFPTYPNPGAWSNNNNSSNCNNATVVFSIHRDQVRANFMKVKNKNSCNPYLLSFKNLCILSDSVHVQYKWNFGDGSPIDTSRSPQHLFSKKGIYFVSLIVKDNSSCNFIDSVKYPIEVLDTAGITAFNELNICHSDSVALGKVFPSDSGITYLWTPAKWISSDTVSNPIAKPDSTISYTVVIKQNGCQQTYSQKITVFYDDFKIGIAQLTGGSNGNACYNKISKLKLTSNNPIKTIEWSNDRYFNQKIIAQTDSSIDLNVVSDTTIYVRAVGKFCGTIAIDSISLKMIKPQFTKTNDTLICKGSTVVLKVKNANVSVPLSFSWTPSNIIVSGQNTNSAKVKPTSTTFVTVVGTSVEGCNEMQTFIIQVDDLKNDSSSFKNISCFNANDASINITVNGIPPYSFTWNDGFKGNNRNTISQGTYTVTINDKLCNTINTFIVTNPEKMIAIPALSNTTCHQACNGSFHTKTVGGTNPYKYRWNTKDTTMNLINLCRGDYSVTITDNHGCSSSLIGTIGLTEKLPKLHAQANITRIYKSQKALLTAVDNAPDTIHFHWIPEQGLENPYSAKTAAHPDSTTTYFVFATDQYGCNAMDTITISVRDFKCEPPYVYIPNAFSPNDDKVNDVLLVESRVVDSLYFAIYTRWGEKVFETRDITKGWDGIYKGEKLSPAVFVYYIDATCINKQRLQRKGNISLLR